MNGQAETRPGLLARAWEWAWRGRALAAARATNAQDARFLAGERARIAAEVALGTLEQRWLAGTAYHLAAALALESIGWSLRAAARSETPAVAAAAATTAPANVDELAALIEAQPELLAEVAGGPAGLERLRGYALTRSFESTAAATDEAEAAARTLAALARRLLEHAARARPATETLLTQRALRSAGLLLVLPLVLLLVHVVSDWHERRLDLALGKPWQASSSYEAVCTSPQHSCGLAKDYFFHTQDESNPWLEIDLTRTQTFSRVHVYNRQDCCSERAVPLVVEVSADHRTWREVARRSDVFNEWSTKFVPQSARWVRFRIARQSLLHLSDVRILP